VQQLAHHIINHINRSPTYQRTHVCPSCQQCHTLRNLSDGSNSKQYDEQSAHMTSIIPKQVKTRRFTWETPCREKTHGRRRAKLHYEDEEHTRWELTNEGRLQIPKSLSQVCGFGASQSPLLSLSLALFLWLQMS
jgi:hypothetical protein